MVGSLVGQLLEIESACYWKVVAYNLVTAKLLTITSEGKSSQFAEPYVVYQALKQENLTECHIYTLLQYFGHLMRRADSLGKTLMLGKIEGKKRRGQLLGANTRDPTHDKVMREKT